MGNGPYRFGDSFLFPVMERLRPSSHTWSPTFISVVFLSSLWFCTCANSFWAICLTLSRSLRHVSAAGIGDLRCFRITCSFMPNRSLWGDFRMMSCLHKLWANSAMGRILLQLVGWLAVQGRRYCSSQAFIHSVCPSMRGWKAVDRFCWTPNTLHISCAKADVKRGS